MKKCSAACVSLLLSILQCFSQGGHLDVMFGATGKTYTNILNLNGGNESIQAAVIQPNGKILLAGTTTSPSIIMRLNPDGSFDPSFDGDGIAYCFNMTITSMALQTDGRIVIGGYTRFGNWNDFEVMRLNSNGTRDMTFGLDGRVTTAVSDADDRATAIAIQSDGKIVAAGVSYNGDDDDFAVVRYLQNGSLDNSFDGDGIVTTAVSSSVGSNAYDQANAIAIQNDGSIVVAGTSYGDFAVARYNSNGSLDNSFHNNGKLITDFGSSDDQAMAIAIQADNKIVVAGFAWDANTGFDFALTRYKPDGTPDHNFDGDGKLTTDLGAVDRAMTVAIQPDGKIIAAGYNDDFLVTRYNADGSPDNSFDLDGQMVTDINGSYDQVAAMALQADGKIILAGRFSTSNRSDIAVTRCNVDGSVDNAFAGGGKFTFSSPCSEDRGTCIAVQPDGKILVAGYTANNLNGSNRDFAIARYNTNGTPDLSFDGDGRLTRAIGPGEDVINAITVQSDGRIIVVGASTRPNSGYSDFAVARYNPDGTPDITFNGDGKTTTAVSAFHNIATAVAIQGDGKIVVAGYSGAGVDVDFAIVRYNSNGTPDNTFDGDGMLTTSVGPTDDRIYSIALQPDGKIVAGGLALSANDIDFAAARYNSNGSLDNSFNGTGTLMIDFGATIDVAYSLALQSDGRILLAGYSKDASSTSFAMARINADGSPDQTLGNSGRMITTAGSFSAAYAVAVQANGKIVVAGDTNNGNNMDVLLARYNSDGTPDNSFDQDGKAVIDLEANSNDHLAGIRIDNDRIYLGGEMTTAGGYDFLVASVLTGPSASTLPLRLLEFAGVLASQDAVLEWKTENEVNTHLFVVERSFDGNSFLPVGEINARGRRSRETYRYIDVAAANTGKPVIYYRLRQIDTDGRFEYSRTIALYPGRSGNTVRFYPNPVNDMAAVTISLARQALVKYRIVDYSGRVLRTSQWQFPAGFSSISLDLRGLAAGSYILELQGEGISYRKQFIKQ